MLWPLAAALVVIPAGGGQIPERGVDVLHYVIAVDIGPEAAAFRGRASITAVITEDGLERLRLDLVGLEVDSVKVGGSAARFARESESLDIELGRRAVGDTVSVEVFYGGAPADGLIFREAHGRPTVFADNWPNRARYWFPGIDHPSDKATVEFRVKAPAEWRVVSVGRLIAEEEVRNGERLTVWRTDRAIPVYTMVIGAAEFSVGEVGSVNCEVEGGGDNEYEHEYEYEYDRDCVRVTRWVYPEDIEGAGRLFGRAAEMVEFYDSLIGPFPYEKLALVQSSTRFGGMENSSAIFFGEGSVRRGGSDVLTAHEIAHQWFGDSVTEMEWPHLWLSEGFATYFAAVFYEFRDGVPAGQSLMQRAETRYMGSAEDVARPVIDTEPADLFELLNANNYQKGGWVLHMLRGVVGDEAFFEGIRRYYAEHTHGVALTSDLRRVMEEESGEELSWFFDQWLRRPGHPEIDVSASWDEDAGALKVQVHQVQAWPPFRLPLEIEASGDGYRLRRTFWVEDREGEHEWALPGAPLLVEVDPENQVLGRIRMIHR
jgi:aminopeptidase N